MAPIDCEDDGWGAVDEGGDLSTSRALGRGFPSRRVVLIVTSAGLKDPPAPAKVGELEGEVWVSPREWWDFEEEETLGDMSWSS